MEAEFISASQADRELLGTKELLCELKLQVREPMPMCIDNQAAIKQLESEKSTSSAKHVDIRFKCICHHTQEGTVVPRFVRSEDMLDDILTKSLPVPRMEELKSMLKLKITQANTEEECKKLSCLTGIKVQVLYRGTVSSDWLITARRDMWDHDGMTDQMGRVRQGNSWTDGTAR